MKEWLGRQKVDDEIEQRTNVPGVATGLAVTGAGGDVLFIETTAFPLAGADGATAEPILTLTGQLGDVMKESAQIALSYVRSHAVELGVDPDTLAKRVHVHVPCRRRAQGRPVGRRHGRPGEASPRHSSTFPSPAL